MPSGSSPPAPAAALIGRTAEVEDVLDLLGRARLVTLSGPPGVGKTRLALAVCARRDDVGWVDLGSVRDPGQVQAELARAADVDGYHSDDRLVVLDNCEHLLETDPDLGSQVVELLRTSSHLRVLTTSRERLRLAAELEYAVPPLPMPDLADADDLDRLRANPAVTLLLDRAPDAVQLTPATARPLAEICIGLDGLPLAIELAAARLRVFTPSELAFRLGRRMSLLTSSPRDAPARHRDLRTAIAWSHDLLPERDRAVFRRLSVFPGEWSIASADEVCAEPEMLDAVESLLDKSLVRRCGDEHRSGADARFTMLMSLREYAAEQLAEHGEVSSSRDRHAALFERQAREWEATLGTEAETATWPQMRDFRADLGAALQQALGSGSATQVVWLATALAWAGYTRGALAEAAVPLAALEWALADPGLDPDAAAAGRLAAGVVAYGRGERQQAANHLDAFLDDAADRPDDRRAAVARAFRGHVAREEGDREDAARLYTAARTAYTRLRNTRGTAWAGHDLAALALDEDRTEEAEVLLRESLRLFESMDYDWAVALCACLLASAVVRSGRPADVDEAAELLGRALRLHEAVGDRRGMAQCLEAVAEVASVRGAAATAARLVGAAAVRRERDAATPTEAESRRLVDLDARLVRVLGRSAADHERHAGRTMPAAAAVELAERVTRGGPDEAEAAAERSAVRLTGRQQEVAAQVAAGLTNRQIGRALGISEKTVEIHVHNVMSKLGLPSRAGVAAWAATRGFESTPVPGSAP